MLFIYHLDTLDAVKWPLVVNLQTTLESAYKIVHNSS